MVGESAGAIAIGSLLVAGGGKAVQNLKLFRGAIMESGAPSGYALAYSIKARIDKLCAPVMESQLPRISTVLIEILPRWWDVGPLFRTEPRCSASEERQRTYWPMPVKRYCHQAPLPSLTTESKTAISTISSPLLKCEEEGWQMSLS